MGFEIGDRDLTGMRDTAFGILDLEFKKSAEVKSVSIHYCFI